MQRENQEIEEKLNQLKQQDNTELKEKQENCRKLVEQLNLLLLKEKKIRQRKKKKEKKPLPK